MRKILLIIFFLLTLTACNNSDTSKPTRSEPASTSSNITNEITTTITDTSASTEKPLDDLVSRSLMNELVHSISLNQDFINTWFESEKEYYSHFFTSNTHYRLERDEVIDYNVQDVIFHEGSLRVMQIHSALEALLLQDLLIPKTDYEFGSSTLWYDRDADQISLVISNSDEELYGWYRIMLELDELWFDALESSKDSPWKGDVINYILYDQNVSYHERTIVTEGNNFHYFQYDYNNFENLVTTFLTTSQPDLGYFDIGRAERHFNDNYYFVYSTGTNYSQKYFTLLHDYRSSISVNEMNINMGDESSSFTEVQWNLLDIPGWTHIENNKVYYNESPIEITPFDYRELPYFGPEFTLFKIFDSDITPEDIANPLGIFDYSVYGIEDFILVQQSLDNLANEFSVTQDTYTAFGVTYSFSNGFNNRLFKLLDETYFNEFQDQLDKRTLSPENLTRFSFLYRSRFSPGGLSLRSFALKSLSFDGVFLNYLTFLR
jgi:hypothetical protein